MDILRQRGRGTGAHRWSVALAASAFAIGGGAAALGALSGGEDGRVAASDGRPPYERAESPLRDAPWLVQPNGSPSVDAVDPLPSLRFSADTPYPLALRQLYVAALERGELPAGTVLGPALPREVVLVESGDQSEGLRLSLTAPWGWDTASRAIRPPSVRLPGELRSDEVVQRIADARALGQAIPQDGAVDVPELHPCQIAVDAPDNRPPCPTMTPTLTPEALR